MTLQKLIEKELAQRAEDARILTALKMHLGDKDCEIEKAAISIYGNLLDFDNPSRADVEGLLRVLQGTKWIKEKSARPNFLNYTSEQPVVAGCNLRLWSADPPGTCRMVEERVVIPAQPERTEIRMVLHCEPEAEPTPATEPEKVST